MTLFNGTFMYMSDVLSHRHVHTLGLWSSTCTHKRKMPNVSFLYEHDNYTIYNVLHIIIIVRTQQQDMAIIKCLHNYIFAKSQAQPSAHCKLYCKSDFRTSTMSCLHDAQLDLLLYQISMNVIKRMSHNMC